MMRPHRILLLYLLLFAIAVPWYWQYLPLENILILGLPAWAFGVLTSSFGISLFSAWVLLRRWPCEDAEVPPGTGSDALPAAGGLTAVSGPPPEQPGSGEPQTGGENPGERPQ